LHLWYHKLTRKPQHRDRMPRLDSNIFLGLQCPISIKLWQPIFTCNVTVFASSFSTISSFLLWKSAPIVGLYTWDILFRM
jgi:hypothetical protein